MKIGVIGESGSGKDELSGILMREYGFMHFSLSRILREEARNVFDYEPDRFELSEFADQLRRDHGETHLLDKTPLLQTERIAISGVYAKAEAEKIRAVGGLIVATVADPEIRYERIKRRGNARDQAVQSFEEFVAQSADELDDTGYEGRVSVGDADVVFPNNGSMEDFQGAVYHFCSNVNLGVVLTSIP